MIGSNPRAVTLRVRTYFCRPWASRVNTKVPVSLACKMAGETNGWMTVSPVDTIFARFIVVAYGAGGSISSA